MPRLGVNIDHVATLRQARGGREPDPLWAALEAENAGADGITVHLREDRRHIQESDLWILRKSIKTRLNLELAVEPSVVAIGLEVRPDQITFVPEKREELTTEGGLDVLGQRLRVSEAVKACQDAEIEVSLFIDPNLDQVRAAHDLGVSAVELHTGRYADAIDPDSVQSELVALIEAGELARRLGLTLHAGHGLNFRNVAPVAKITGMAELNIGHSLVSAAIICGIGEAVRAMKAAIRGESIS
jgi:pyridoxine 5-phosphate synthase